MQVPPPAPSAAPTVAILDCSGSLETPPSIDQVDNDDGARQGSDDDANDQDASARAAADLSTEDSGGCNDKSIAPKAGGLPVEENEEEAAGEAGKEGDRVTASSGLVEDVLSALPTFSRKYTLGPPGLYACYVNDELGSAFRHSERPNCQVSGFGTVQTKYVQCFQAGSFFIPRRLPRPTPPRRLFDVTVQVVRAMYRVMRGRVSRSFLSVY